MRPSKIASSDREQIANMTSRTVIGSRRRRTVRLEERSVSYKTMYLTSRKGRESKWKSFRYLRVYLTYTYMFCVSRAVDSTYTSESITKRVRDRQIRARSSWIINVKTLTFLNTLTRARNVSCHLWTKMFFRYIEFFMRMMSVTHNKTIIM